MPNFGKMFLFHFYALNSFYMFWAQVVFRMHKFYVSTFRFCSLILEILWKISVTEFSYQTYHRSKCIDICDCENGSANFSTISATLTASQGDKTCHEYAVGAPPYISPSYRVFWHSFLGLICLLQFIHLWKFMSTYLRLCNL